jgi:hypothetical protein
MNMDVQKLKNVKINENNNSEIIEIRKLIGEQK